MRKALYDLRDYIKEYRPQKIWANGVCFDISILEDCYDQNNIEIPWRYNQVMDARTIYKTWGASKEDWDDAKKGIKGDPHNPLYDCKIQANLLRSVLCD